MRVAQFLYSGLGGHGSVAFSLIEGDLERRWSNALGFIGIEPLLDDYSRRCEAAQIPFSYFHAVEGRPWARWRSIHEWLNSIRPEAIICHGGPGLIPSYVYARRRGVPLVFVEHTSALARKWTEKLYGRVGLLAADAVVVLTEEFEPAAKTSGARRCGKLRVIPNGVNTDRFWPSGRNWAKRSSTRLGMASRLTGTKRHEILITVLGHLRQIRPDHQWTLSFAGDGEERRRLEELARPLGCQAVEFTGTLNEAALATWYRGLDLYVHASDTEALSTAILQAMASGLPIVASDVPGIAAVLRNGTAILKDNRDAEGWAEKIAELTGSPEQAAALATNARALCERNYNHLKMHRAYDALIRSLLNRTASTTEPGRVPQL